MDSLGNFLREAREAQGLTFEQIAASTKIQESYLQAIEEEHFQVLPPKVFTKGFVRTYAQTLGLDEEEAMWRFSAVTGSYYLEEENHQQVVQRAEDDRKRKANRNAVIILTGITLIGLVFILPREQSPSPTLSQEQRPESAFDVSTQQTDSIPGLLGKSDAAQEKRNPTTSLNVEGTPIPVDPVVNMVTTPSGSIPSESKPEEIVEKMPVVMPLEPMKTIRSPFEPGMGEQDGPIMLELEALEITWVVVQSDDRDPHEALLQPGERVLWRAHNRFLITLGNAGGVKVSLNGEPRGPFGKHGKVVRNLEIKP